MEVVDIIKKDSTKEALVERSVAQEKYFKAQDQSTRTEASQKVLRETRQLLDNTETAVTRALLENSGVPADEASIEAKEGNAQLQVLTNASLSDSLVISNILTTEPRFTRFNQLVQGIGSYLKKTWTESAWKTPTDAQRFQAEIKPDIDRFMDAVARGDPEADVLKDKLIQRVDAEIEASMKPEFRQKLETAADTSPWKVKLVERLATLLVMGLGIYMALKMLADYLTGCYKFQNSAQQKVSCPNSNDSSFCDCSTPPVVDSVVRDVFCASNDHKKYPFCCDKANPVCAGIPGTKGSLYYTFRTMTPSDVLGQGVDAVSKIVNDAGEGISNIWNHIRVYVYVVVGVAVLLVLLRIIIPLFKKHQ